MRVAAIVLALCGLCAAESVEITVHLDRPTRPISPLIYGANIHGDIDGFDRFTALRNGGNANSTYNWENNCNNAGNDYQHASSRWVSRFVENTPLINEPAGGIRGFHERAKKLGVYDLQQLPLVGFVAADAEGPVPEDQKPPSKRWKRVELKKAGAISETPDTTDDVVYIDEMLTYLVKHLGRADRGGIRGYGLDNEPEYWHLTHPRIYPEPVTVRELVDKSIAAARIIKQIDPSAEVFGPAITSIKAFDNLNDAKDWPQVLGEKNYHWFVDYYLDRMRAESEKAGVRLLDAFEIHTYADRETELAGGFNAILQSPRWLWDPTHRPISWVGELFPQHMPLLTKVRESIDKFYPGTKLAVTEYNMLMPETIWGSLATADELGVFGREGVYLATIWSLLSFEKQGDEALPLTAAFSLYRDFDGKGGCFGDESIHVTNPRPDVVSLHAARDSKTGTIHLIAISKTRHARTTMSIQFAGQSPPAQAHLWGYDQTSFQIRSMGVRGLEDRILRLEIPRTSAWHLVLSAGKNPPAGGN